MNRCIILIRASAIPALIPCPEAGAFVVEMDLEARHGFGELQVTRDARQAKVFANPAEALEYYQRVPVCRPHRDDGRPNKPLTAYTVEIIPALPHGVA